MKVRGFQNAPGVKKMKAGMRIKLPEYLCHGGEWAIVKCVSRTGTATCETEGHGRVFVLVSNLYDCILDPASVWVGREYVDSVGSHCLIMFVSKAFVAYILCCSDGSEYADANGVVQTKKKFLSFWKPVPIPSIDPISPPEKKSSNNSQSSLVNKPPTLTCKNCVEFPSCDTSANSPAKKGCFEAKMYNKDFRKIENKVLWPENEVLDKPAKLACGECGDFSRCHSRGVESNTPAPDSCFKKSTDCQEENKEPVIAQNPLYKVLCRLWEVRDGNTAYQMKPSEGFSDIIEAIEIIASELQKRTTK